MRKIVFFVAVVVLAKWWFSSPNVSATSSDISFNYVVQYPGQGGRSDKLPMLIALHGNGDTPKNFYRTALDLLSENARVILLQGPFPSGLGKAWPWNRQNFASHGKAMNEAVELLVEKYPTVGKPVLLGFSGGGMMAYYQALTHGDAYSYIIPVSGKLSEDELGDQPIKVGAKVQAYHGESDNVVILSGAKEAVRLLRTHGVNAELVEFTGGHQGIFSNMKSDITKAVEQKILILR